MTDLQHGPESEQPNGKDRPVSRAEFDAAMFAQELRLFRIILNFIKRKQYSESDPRRAAIVEAVVWRICVALTPVAAASTAGAIGLIGIWLAFNANGLTENQNRLIESQSALMQTQTELMTDQNEQIRIQNELLGKQNKAISVQTELSESSRRAAIQAELGDLLALITEFIKTETSKDSPAAVQEWKLPDVYYSRIISLLRDMRPYRYVNRDLVKSVDWVVWYPSGSHTHIMKTHIGPLSKSEMTEPELNEHALSPERGQMLYSLVLMQVDLDPRPAHTK